MHKEIILRCDYIFNENWWRFTKHSLYNFMWGYSPRPSERSRDYSDFMCLGEYLWVSCVNSTHQQLRDRPPPPVIFFFVLWFMKITSEPQESEIRSQLRRASIGQSWWCEPSSRRSAFMMTLGGEWSSVWFLYRKPGLTAIRALRAHGRIAESVLVKAAISDTLLPEAKATRNKVYIRRWADRSLVFQYWHCSNIVKTLLEFQAGIIFLGGGSEWIEIGWTRRILGLLLRCWIRRARGV